MAAAGGMATGREMEGTLIGGEMENHVWQMQAPEPGAPGDHLLEGSGGEWEGEGRRREGKAEGQGEG